MPEIFLRPYRTEDRVALLRMLSDLQNHERRLHGGRRPGREVAALYLSKLEALNGKRSGRIIVADSGGRIVGFVSCRAEDHGDVLLTPDANRYGYISDVFVSAKHRRHGIAEKLLAAANQHLVDLGLRRVVVRALAANDSAWTIYERHGFKPYEVTFEKTFDGPPDGAQ